MAQPKSPNEAIVDGGLPSGIVQAIKTVTTSGTAVALAASTKIKGVVIRAEASNTNDIFVGGSDVDTSNGFPLSAGKSISLEIDDLANVFIDATTDTEGVNYLAVLF